VTQSIQHSVSSAVSIDQMRPKLLTLPAVLDTLGSTEPLSTHEFSIGERIAFEVDPGWQHGLDAKAGTEQVGVRAIIGQPGGIREFPLTKDALLEATSLCGMGKGYAARCPAELLEPALNYWYSRGLAERQRGIKDFQLLATGGTGAAITRASITPFSNLRLTEQILAAIGDRYGEQEILVDYKFHHSLRRTHLRLILPGQSRLLVDTGTPDDTWSVGVQLKNSLTGEERTAVEGYLFRWTCTNGAIDTAHSTGAWTRRGNSTEDDAYEWARATVEEVLGGLEPALDAVQGLTKIPVEGEVNDVLRDVFSHYRVAVPDRARIIENMVEQGGDLTMYSVMAAVTQAANVPDLDPAHLDNLLRMGGDLAHTAPGRCGSCRRLMGH
jgi:hypothetical protein